MKLWRVGNPRVCDIIWLCDLNKFLCTQYGCVLMPVCVSVCADVPKCHLYMHVYVHTHTCLLHHVVCIHV